MFSDASAAHDARNPPSQAAGLHDQGSLSIVAAIRLGGARAQCSHETRDPSWATGLAIRRVSSVARRVYNSDAWRGSSVADGKRDGGDADNKPVSASKRGTVVRKVSEQPFSIICLSPQEWRAALPTNRQQVMLRAAQRGHQVLFVETGHFFGRHVWALFRRRGRRSLARRLFSTEEVIPGVLLRKSINVLPWDSKYRLVKAINSVVTARFLRRLATNLSKPVVLWIYDPGAAGMAGSCGEAFAVYDCVDDYAEHATSARKREMVLACDRMAVLRSQLVFTTSTAMYKRQRRLNSATHLVANAGDYEHFVGAADRAIAAPEVSGLPRCVLGFAGNFLVSKVDFDLLEDVAHALPHWTLLLIGPAGPETASALKHLAELPSVHWLGQKPYSELPRYVAAFDVGLIPYVSNAYTRSCFPLKLYEYLAAGKPVVASGLPELAGMEPDVTLADGPASFIRAVQDAAGRNTEADKLRRSQLAARNSWEKKTERLLGLVQGKLDARRPAA
jgi:glycosyltransferase involved in cell wall biosynthesis